ncbi:MAG: hypothetical protein ACYTF6_14205, partial [Planctomycetota bacterium]
MLRLAVNRHEYTWKRDPEREFAEVEKHTVKVTKRGNLSGFTGDAITELKYNRHGEITEIIRKPGKAQQAGRQYKQEFKYEEEGSVAGNLLYSIVHAAKRIETKYERYDLRINLPTLVKDLGYMNPEGSDSCEHWAETKYDYKFEKGKFVITVTEQKAKAHSGKGCPEDKSTKVTSSVYRAEDGLLDYTVDRRNVKTQYWYYGKDQSDPHFPGDAWDRVGMLAMTVVATPGARSLTVGILRIAAVAVECLFDKPPVGLTINNWADGEKVQPTDKHINGYARPD